LKTLSEEKRRIVAANFSNDIADRFISLYYRFLDENEFESIDEYGKVFASLVEEIGGEYVKTNKRPFGFDYRLSGVVYRVFLSGGKYGYKVAPPKAPKKNPPKKRTSPKALPVANSAGIRDYLERIGR